MNIRDLVLSTGHGLAVSSLMLILRKLKISISQDFETSSFVTKGS